MTKTTATTALALILLVGAPAPVQAQQQQGDLELQFAGSVFSTVGQDGGSSVAGLVQARIAYFLSDRVQVGTFPREVSRGGLVPELLSTQLANIEHLTLVERLRVEDVLDELELRARGITESRGLELGRMLNADLVVVGSIGGFGTSTTLSARVLRVETGEVVSGRQVLCEGCRGPDLFEAVHLLGTAIAR